MNSVERLQGWPQKQELFHSYRVGWTHIRHIKAENKYETIISSAQSHCDVTMGFYTTFFPATVVVMSLLLLLLNRGTKK